jgi:hypothetical protein
MVGVFIHVKVWLKKSVGPPPPDWPTLLLSRTFTYINTPTTPSQLLFLLKRPMKMEQSVPKRRYREFRRRGIAQKKEYNIHNAAKVSNQENLDVLEIIKNSTHLGDVLWNDVSNEKWT